MQSNPLSFFQTACHPNPQHIIDPSNIPTPKRTWRVFFFFNIYYYFYVSSGNSPRWNDTGV